MTKRANGSAPAAVLLRKRHTDPAPLAHTAAELRIEPRQPAVATWHEQTGLELSGQEVADLIAQVGAPGRQRARVEQREFHGHLHGSPDNTGVRGITIDPSG